MYYAIYRPYGKSTYSSGDTLYRFETKAERDDKVRNEPWDGSNYHWIAVTKDEARRWFPRAFANLDWFNSDVHTEVWDSNMWCAAPTGGEYAYLS